MAQTSRGQGFLRKQPIMAQKWPKWPIMAKNSPEDVICLRMATFGVVCFLYFFDPIALNGTWALLAHHPKSPIQSEWIKKVKKTTPKVAILRRFTHSGEFFLAIMLLLYIWVRFKNLPPLVDFSLLKTPSRHMQSMSPDPGTSVRPQVRHTFIFPFCQRL